MKNNITDMSGLILKSLRRSIIGTNGTPSMKALDLFAKIEGLVDSTSKVDVNIGAGGRSNDDLENELAELEKQLEAMEDADEEGEDRKSTRLNSSHVASSYAVFCLKKKTRKQE